MAQASDYTALIPSANARQPKFLAMVAAAVQPFVDLINFYQALPAQFDLGQTTAGAGYGGGGYGGGGFGPTTLVLAQAAGAQLDIIGLWVGVSRFVAAPLEAWFSFDTANLGWDQGVWWDPFQPTSGSTALDDDTFRLLIQAKIAWNRWDGTTPSFYAILVALFNPLSVSITDNLNHSISITVSGPSRNAALKRLATNGLLPFIPVGVSVSYTFA